MTTILNKIREFTVEAHKGQVRKFTGEPYSNHPIRVMESVKKHTSFPPVLAASLLHDVIEDTNKTLEDIRNFITKNWTDEDSYSMTIVKNKIITQKSHNLVRDVFIKLTLENVHSLTRTKELSKDDYNRNLEESCNYTKLIKLMDIYDNCSTVCLYDKKYGKKYIEGKVKMIHFLFNTDFPEAYNRTVQMLLNELDNI